MKRGIATSNLGWALHIKGRLIARLAECYVSPTAVLEGPCKSAMSVKNMYEMHQVA